ncbi:F-box/LRR-repeat protein 15, partial [Armadillidium vulgare]
MLRILSTHYKALITEYLRVVVQLDFHGSQISNSSFYSLTEACKNLKSLSVWDCRKLEDKSIIQILQNNTDLELLDIGKCPLLSSDILQQFKLCKNLKKLSLQHSQWLNNKGLHLIIEYLDELECLDISKCFKISEEAILTLINSYPGIRELNLSYIECVDDQILITLAEHCKSLECLSLNNCWRITERGILKSIKDTPTHILNACLSAKYLKKLDIAYAFLYNFL